MGVIIKFVDPEKPIEEALELARTLQNLSQNHDELEFASGEIDALVRALEEIVEEGEEKDESS